MSTQPKPAVQFPDRPKAEDILERARSLRPDLLAAAAQTEADRRVSAEAMASFEEAGLIHVSRSRRYGGYAYGPSMLVRLGYELGQGCGSAAWCANLASSNSWLASYFSEQAQDEIWGGNENALLTTIVAPTGQSKPVDGGYELSGRWPWASNCDNSQWACVGAIIPETAERPAGTGWFLVPMDELVIDQDSWFVSGMQGTGSKTIYAASPLFVPAHRVIYFDDIANRKAPGCLIGNNSPALFAFSTFGAATLAGPVLGMAQGALNLFAGAMKDKLRVAMKPGVKLTADQNPFVQERLGRAQAMINCAFVSLTSTLEQSEERIFAGKAPGVDERIRVRMALVQSVRLSVDAVNLIMETAGASATDSHLPLQRFWRDINAAVRHISFDTTTLFPVAGQHILGLEPKMGY